MTSAEIFEILQRRAIDLHGDTWMAGLVRDYVAIAKAKGDTKATVQRRRPQLERAFKKASCTLDTLLMICEALDLRLKIVAEIELT